jgi:prolyl oligopeptidase
LYGAPVDALGKPDTPWQRICDVADDVTAFAVHGDELYLLSHKGAPHYKVMRTSRDFSQGYSMSKCGEQK